VITVNFKCFAQGTIHSLWTLSSDSESYHDHSPKTEEHIDQVEISKPRISQPPGEAECKDGLLHDNNGKSPSKKTSKEKSSQKQIDVKGCTPVKGKITKGNIKGTGVKWLIFYFYEKYEILLYLHAYEFEICFCLPFCTRSIWKGDRW
jgi:hypothetical protein